MFSNFVPKVGVAFQTCTATKFPLLFLGGQASLKSVRREQGPTWYEWIFIFLLSLTIKGG